MEHSSKYEIAKKIADDFDLVKRCTKVSHSEVGHRKSSEPANQEELEASLDLYLTQFKKILKALDNPDS